jgi:hypothetical protein
MSVHYFIVISSVWTKGIMNSKPIKPHVNYENRRCTGKQFSDTAHIPVQNDHDVREQYEQLASWNTNKRVPVTNGRTYVNLNEPSEDQNEENVCSDEPVKLPRNRTSWTLAPTVIESVESAADAYLRQPLFRRTPRPVRERLFSWSSRRELLTAKRNTSKA